MTHLAYAVQGSVVYDIPAEVDLGEVGEVSEHWDEELGVDGGGVSQAEGQEAGAPLLQEAQGVVDGAGHHLHCYYYYYGQDQVQVPGQVQVRSSSGLDLGSH